MNVMGRGEFVTVSFVRNFRYYFPKTGAGELHGFHFLLSISQNERNVLYHAMKRKAGGNNASRTRFLL